MDGVAESKRANLEGQIDFFGLGAETPRQAALVLPDLAEYSPAELMRMEKETTGLYLSAHPMDACRELAKRAGAVPIGKVRDDFAQEGGATVFSDGQQITLAGVVTSRKTKTTKRNTLMAYVTLEDDTGSLELLCFARCLENSGAALQEGKVVAARGRLSVRDEKAPQLMCDSAVPLDGSVEVSAEAPPERASVAKPQQVKGETLYLRVPSEDAPEMLHLRRVLFMFEGEQNPVRIRLADTGRLIGTSCDLHDSRLRELRETLGAENVVVK